MIRAAVTALGAGAPLCAGVVLLATGAWRTALRILLDLLTAAGLLGLSGAPGWGALAGAASVVALRQLLWAALAAPPPAADGVPDPHDDPVSAARR
ncbi:hypothetical protein GA0074692_1775 [Micromonospora pallida]|uniref:Uncharacterized protein n=1 Tax=Micromonospora pallida TaxID=145854 RepID=A0A1C6S4S4_9ACTN|nr:hypothetical protein [Micromonospora pallida]SCL24476.1 hypothetical protein GA0074692_1775 [Micromonospora pallida]